MRTAHRPDGAWLLPRARRLGAPVLLLLLTAAALLLGACTGAEDGTDPSPAAPQPPEDDDTEPPHEGPVAGGTLRVGLLVDPVSIDPRFIVDDEGELLVDALFDPLVRLDADGEPVAAAARRWEVDEDGRRFTFHLRDAVFHDGTPVTAEDFKRTFDHIADRDAEPPSFLAYLLEDVVGIDAAQAEGGGIDGVEVEDERTLIIELETPLPGFLATLADPSLVPIPEAAASDPEAYGLQPIGNGPFAMAGPREPGAFLRLVRAEDHHAPALIEEVLFTLYDTGGHDDAQWEDLLDGQLHVAQVMPTRREEAEELFGRSQDGYTGPGLLDGARTPVYMYGFDTSRAPFDDPRLRRAISLAIDRDALANEVAEGTRLPATSLVPPGIPGAQPRACDACRHDPDAAAELLEEVTADLAAAQAEEEAAQAEEEAASETDADDTAEEDAVDREEPSASDLIGVVTLSYNRGSLHGAIAERMAMDLEDALDLEVEFQGQELAGFLRGVRSGDLAVFRHGWDVTEPSPTAYLYPLFHSSQIGVDNLTRFEDAEVDQLLETARTAEQPLQRRRAARDAEREILAQMPAIPLLWYQHDTVVRPEVRDLRYAPSGRLSLSEAWFDPEVETG